MKQRVLMTAVGVLAAMALACSTTQPIGTMASDAEVTASVKSRLAADPALNPFEFDVDTTDGVVRLGGIVESEADRRHALELARETDGVREVIDDVQLGDPSFTENARDAWIGTKIKAKLIADPEVGGTNVDVDVLQGDVTLTGVVGSDEASEEAEKLARETDGVTSVTNRLEVARGR